ncbi:MAG: beta-glucosidase [Deltaproteobacteria bacterium]|nr:beta-glucosidase [Deltaproteobacteria bacterium]
MTTIRFPADFLWGAATSAYQIEGAHDADGKGPSNWDIFSRKSNKISDNTNGEVTCDHYHRYKEDVKLMSAIGLDAYRFSVSWPRVLPSGTGAVNQPGLDFYDQLVDELMAAKIVPFVTLYHWDLPYALERRGGWTDRDISSWFAEYCEVVVDRLGDRVNHWITLNEPLASSAMGYLYGEHAPGRRGKFIQFLKAAHNLNLAHGKALERIRHISEHSIVGISNVTSAIYPAVAGEGERAVDTAHQFVNELFMMPLIKGEYPPFITKLMRWLNKDYSLDDMKTISQPIDFVGVNNYTRRVVKKSLNPLIPFKFVTPEYEGKITTGMGWEVFPKGMYDVLKWIKDTYGDLVVFITENGTSISDEVSEDGKIHDTSRIEFLEEYLFYVKKAIREGVNVRGYFVWSMLDNFEWNHGLSSRFGLVHVNYETLTRTVKDSANWYRDVCKNNGFKMNGVSP